MTRMVLQMLLALTFAVAVSQRARAHEQRFIGIVHSIEGVHLRIETTDAKAVVVMLHDKTRISRGKETKRAEDIKAGSRIVVITTDGTHNGKPMLMAKEIRLGAAPAPKK